MKTAAFGTYSPTLPLEKIDINRREVQNKDVEIEILYSGVCHSDLHTVRNEWKDAHYPVVPGHEIIGRVMSVGSDVTKYKVGDMVGVGVLVESCRNCTNCQHDLEQFCENGPTYTYNSPDNYLGGETYGGYSSKIVVREDFVLRLPENLDPASSAPLLCAGITTYSPLKFWKISKGKKVGIIGIGGLGHVAVKIAKAMGAYVVALTTSDSKKSEALRLGADEVLITLDNEALKAQSGSFDFLLDTVSAEHNIDSLLRLLKLDGVMTMVGLPPEALPVSAVRLISPRRILTGSSIGGLHETQEMLDFCAEHQISCDIELIQIQDINKAYDRLLKGDVRYRFVIDMASIRV